MNQTIIIPAYRPSSPIVQLTRDLRELGFGRILIVDDGSGPQYKQVFDQASQAGAVVVKHEVNHGKGAALRTGITFAREYWPESRCFVTADADGQHLPADIAHVATESALHPTALVLGCRNFDEPDVPARSRLGNRIASRVFQLDTGVRIADTQTGLRALPLRLCDAALACAGDHYDWEMNVLTSLTHAGCDLWVVPISTVYLNRNEASHFHPIADSARIMAPMLRFAGASLASAAVDLGVFALLGLLLGLQGAMAIFGASVVARLVSGVVNFALNRSWSFSATQGRAGTQFARYVTLFVAQMLVSSLLVTLLVQLGAPAVAAKVVVDGSLFFVSYRIQRSWVFARSTSRTSTSSDLVSAGALPQ